MIKGSIDYGVFIRYISKKQYEAIGSPLLTKQEKKTVYYIFLQYESWKAQTNSYDFLDVVNHVLSCKNSLKNMLSKFEYLIIDEVQDLQPKTIKLLMMQTCDRVIFAGDTA